MRRALAVAVLLLAPQLFAQASDKVREGIALFDQGRYDEAFAKYKEALAANPQDATAAYELGLTYAAKGDYGQCAATLDPIASRPSQSQLTVLTMLGNCLDSGGNRTKAIEAYRRGLKIAPDDPALNFELGIALYGAGKYAEARQALQKDTLGRPGHAMGRYALAQAFETSNFRIPALLEFLHFLALDPSSARAAESAKHVRALMNAGVEQKDSKNITLTVDPDGPKDEGDYNALAMGVTLAAAARFTEKNENKSEFEQWRGALDSALNIFIEMTATTRRDYTARAHVPFFSAMKKAGLMETFAGIALLPLRLDGGDAWAKANAKPIADFEKWMEPQRNARAIVEMPVK